MSWRSTLEGVFCVELNRTQDILKAEVTDKKGLGGYAEGSPRPRPRQEVGATELVGRLGGHAAREAVAPTC